MDRQSYPMSLSPRRYALQPSLLDAAEAHRTGQVTYRADGTVEVRHSVATEPELFAPSQQFPLVRATFDDLNKALSRLANSPLLEDGSTLRESYEAETARYEELSAQALSDGKFEPDYGSYLLDHVAHNLYLIAPAYWHRLALVTSQARLLTDPAGLASWRELRKRLEGAVVGFAGLSVGSNLLEGWLREARPAQVKLADPDWLELTNLNRCERASLRHLVQSRAARFDPRNPYESLRVSKAGCAAYEQNLVDPYLECFVVDEPLSSRNAERFLLGNGSDEPRLDILVEEIDELSMKVELRELARRHGIDVLMLTDFGHRTQALWNPFRTDPRASLGVGGDDQRLKDALVATRSGERARIFAFIEELCGVDFAGDPFDDFVQGRGEQPTGSLPQSGATTLVAGGLGGKELALRVLGHPRELTTRGLVWDLMGREVRER